MLLQCLFRASHKHKLHVPLLFKESAEIFLLTALAEPCELPARATCRGLHTSRFCGASTQRRVRRGPWSFVFWWQCRRSLVYGAFSATSMVIFRDVQTPNAGPIAGLESPFASLGVVLTLSWIPREEKRCRPGRGLLPGLPEGLLRAPSGAWEDIPVFLPGSQHPGQQVFKDSGPGFHMRR